VKKKQKKTVKINFLLQKKNLSDKFYDLLEKNTEKKFAIYTKGKKKGEDYYKGRKGKKEFGKKLGVDTRTVTRWEKYGIAKLTKKQEEKIKKLHNERTKKIIYYDKNKKIVSEKKDAEFYETKNVRLFSKEKKETKQFTKHTFTKENFFHKKKLPRRKKRQQFYFRAGLWMRFINGYIIKNMPVSHYDFRGYPEGYKAMWNLIQNTISSYDSLDIFRINYFDVLLLDMDK